MKRWIGGFVFSILSVFSILCGFFNYLLLAFLIVGIYEMIQMYKIKKSNYLYFYALLYFIGIITMWGIFNSAADYMLIFVGAIMLNDSFAYFTGRAIGKTKFYLYLNLEFKFRRNHNVLGNKILFGSEQKIYKKWTIASKYNIIPNNIIPLGEKQNHDINIKH